MALATPAPASRPQAAAAVLSEANVATRSARVTPPIPAPLVQSASVAVPIQRDDGSAGVPELWNRVLEVLCESQPALGAVLEHAVPLEVGASKFLLGFAEGSFHGRQAASALSRQALGDAAERMFGERPTVEVKFGTWKQPSLASQERERRQKQREDMRQSALSHPRVKDALDVFPEASEGPVDVQPEDDR